MERSESGKMTKHPIRVGQRVILVKVSSNDSHLGLKLYEPYEVIATSLSGSKARNVFYMSRFLSEDEFVFIDRDGDKRTGSLVGDIFGRKFEVLKED